MVIIPSLGFNESVIFEVNHVPNSQVSIQQLQWNLVTRYEYHRKLHSRDAWKTHWDHNRDGMPNIIRNGSGVVNPKFKWDSSHCKPCFQGLYSLREWRSYSKIWVHFLSLTRRKLRLCSANHRAGCFSNLGCDWLSIVWAYSEQETENGPWWSLETTRLDAIMII